MRNPQPTFPPLLTGHRLAADRNPFNWAVSKAGKGKLGAGDLAWSEDARSLRLALVLEPDVPRKRCGEILYVVMAAFGDAAGALIPPEVAITYRWPSAILMNNGQIGFVDLVLSDEDIDRVPDWMVIGLDIRINPDPGTADPGLDINNTTMWDEGCGGITRTALLESVARHSVNLIHNWSEEGFGPTHTQWWGRVSKEMRIADGIDLDPGQTLMGLDETGNALMSGNGETVALHTIDALTELRNQRVPAR